jgi:hypothetical protein
MEQNRRDECNHQGSDDSHQDSDDSLDVFDMSENRRVQASVKRMKLLEVKEGLAKRKANYLRAREESNTQPSEEEDLGRKRAREQERHLRPQEEQDCQRSEKEDLEEETGDLDGAMMGIETPSARQSVSNNLVSKSKNLLKNPEVVKMLWALKSENSAEDIVKKILDSLNMSLTAKQDKVVFHLHFLNCSKTNT